MPRFPSRADAIKYLEARGWTNHSGNVWRRRPSYLRKPKAEIVEAMARFEQHCAAADLSIDAKFDAIRAALA